MSEKAIGEIARLHYKAKEDPIDRFLPVRGIRKRMQDLNSEPLGAAIIEAKVSRSIATALEEAVTTYKEWDLDPDIFQRIETNVGDAIIEETGKMSQDAILAEKKNGPRLTALNFTEDDFSKLNLSEKMILFRILKSARVYIQQDHDYRKDYNPTFKDYKNMFEEIGERCRIAYEKFESKSKFQLSNLATRT